MTCSVKEILNKAHNDHKIRTEYLNFYIKAFRGIVLFFLGLSLSTLYSKDLHLLAVYSVFCLVFILLCGITVYQREKELDRLIEITIEKIRNAEKSA